MVRNKLKLNRGKTALSARHRPPPLIEYVDVSGERIKPSLSARNIGVIFDEHMSLDEHVTNTCKACFFHLRNISKIRDSLSPADTEKLVHAFITSKLDSANSLLYGLPTFLIDRLQNVQNAAARIITISVFLLQQPVYGTLSATLSDRVACYRVLRPIRKHTFLKNVII